MKCKKAHSMMNDQCAFNTTTQAGRQGGGCAIEPSFFQKLIVSNLFPNTYKVPTQLRSPGYDAVKGLQISNLDTSEIVSGFYTSGYDKHYYKSRESTCLWVLKNFDSLRKYIPNT